MLDLSTPDETAEAMLNVVRASDGSATVHRLVGHKWSLGRGRDADVRLDDELVADRHAELRRCPFGRWWIHDQGTASGTFVNGHRVRSHILWPDDTIAIGHFVIQVRPTARASEGSIPPPPAELGEPVDDDADTMILVDRGAGEPGAASAALVGAFQLNAAVELEGDLMRVDTVRERREALCSWLVDPLGATQAHFVRLRADGVVSVSCGSTSDGAQRARLSRTLLDALWHRRELVAAASRDEARPRAVLGCPLKDHAGWIDAVYVELGPDHATEEWRALVAIGVGAYLHADMASRMSVELRTSAAVEQELRTADKLQHRLFAKVDTYPEGLDIITEYQPCLWVGGDYVDAVSLPDSRALLVTADVSGKGLQGAMVASILHTLVRATVDSGEQLSSLLGRMNRHLCSYLPDHSFVTLIAVILDPRSGHIESINAGHPPAILCSDDGTLRSLPNGRNVALGMWPTTFETDQDRLRPGEILILYTDGMGEGLEGTRDPTARGLWDAVAQVVRRNADAPLEVLAEELRRRLRENRRAGVAADDAAFLLARGRDQRETARASRSRTQPAEGAATAPAFSA